MGNEGNQGDTQVDEFGSLGGVSSLKSRFERLAQEGTPTIPPPPSVSSNTPDSSSLSNPGSAPNRLGFNSLPFRNGVRPKPFTNSLHPPTNTWSSRSRSNSNPTSPHVEERSFTLPVQGTPSSEKVASLRTSPSSPDFSQYRRTQEYEAGNGGGEYRDERGSYEALGDVGAENGTATSVGSSTEGAGPSSSTTVRATGRPEVPLRTRPPPPPPPPPSRTNTAPKPAQTSPVTRKPPPPPVPARASIKRSTSPRNLARSHAEGTLVDFDTGPVKDQSSAQDTHGFGHTPERSSSMEGSSSSASATASIVSQVHARLNFDGRGGSPTIIAHHDAPIPMDVAHLPLPILSSDPAASRSNSPFLQTTNLSTGSDTIPRQASPQRLPAPKPVVPRRPPERKLSVSDVFSASPAPNSALPIPPPLPSRKTNSPARPHALSQPELPMASLLGSAPPPPPPPRPSPAHSASAPNVAPSVRGRRQPPPPPVPPPPIISSTHRSEGDKASTISLPELSASLVGSSPPMPDAPLPPPPTRNVLAGLIPPPRRPITKVATNRTNGTGTADSEGSDAEDDGSITSTARSLSEIDMPDATRANRHPPALDYQAIHVKNQFHCHAVRGRYICTGTHHVRVWDAETGMNVSSMGLIHDVKITAMGFKRCSESDHSDEARFFWGGTKDGQLFEFDVQEQRVIEQRSSAHSCTITGIWSHGLSMVTMDESGKVQVWSPVGDALPRVSDHPRTQRIADKQTFTAMLGRQLWASSGPANVNRLNASAPRGPMIRVYEPISDGPFTVNSRPITTPESAGYVGGVTCGTLIPSQPDHVYLGHETGHVSVWSKETYTCVSVLKISNYQITCMEGVTKYLWAGYRTGFIYVYDVEELPWRVVKVWKAHKDGVTGIVVDPSMLWTGSTLHVASTGQDQYIRLWDGLMKDDWIDSELFRREAEYCTYRPITVLISSWNVDANKPSDLHGDADNMDFLHNCLSSVDTPDIIVFGYQEMIDLENKKLTAKSMLLGKKKADSMFSDSVSQTYRLWHDKLVQAIRTFMPPDCPYSVVHAENLVGLFTCVFVKNSERSTLRDVAMTTVKTGLGGRYGNKGAIIARFVIDDSSLCFVNCHLAAGQRHKRQRNNDLVDILEEKSAFAEVGVPAMDAYWGGGNGSMVLDHEICFLNGDLNYRIDLRREIVMAAVAENDLATLLEHDQLLKEKATNLGFRLRAFVEAPITFAPTYKYDPGTDDYDTSEKARIPAWCDRILWRANRADKVKPLKYQRYEARISDHKPISGAFLVKVKRVDLPSKGRIEVETRDAWQMMKDDLIQAAKDFYTGN